MCVEKKGNCGPARGNMIHALQKSLERGGAELSPQGFDKAVKKGREPNLHLHPT
jgi:hypothetical protein